jgi:hypothetical protein
MAKKRVWTRPELEEEQTVTQNDTKGDVRTAYLGIANRSVVKAYMANGWKVFTVSDIRSRQDDTRIPVAKDKELTSKSADTCYRAWNIHHFPVVVFPAGTEEGCAKKLRSQAVALYANEEQEQKESALESAEKMTEAVADVVSLYQLYITIEGRIEGGEIAREKIDPDVAKKLLRYRESAGYLGSVFTKIVQERLNGQFNIVDAYRKIGPPTQELARLAIDTAIIVSEICYQMNQLIAKEQLQAKYEGLEPFTMEVVADLCITAIFMNCDLWVDDPVTDGHAARSAENYLQMRLSLQKFPEVEELIALHDKVWPTDHVYRLEVETTVPTEGSPRKSCKHEYHVGSGPRQERGFIRKTQNVFDLLGLDDTGIELDVLAYPVEATFIMHVCVLNVAEQIVSGVGNTKKLARIFDQMAKHLSIPPSKEYSVEGCLSKGLPIYSRVLAAASHQYGVFSIGSVVLFTNGTGEKHGGVAVSLAVDGGIAVVIKTNPVELLLISHEKLAGGLLDPATSIQDFIAPTMGRRLPKQRLISLGVPVNRQIFQKRGTVLGVVDSQSLESFLAQYEERISEARTIL